MTLGEQLYIQDVAINGGHQEYAALASALKYHAAAAHDQ